MSSSRVVRFDFQKLIIESGEGVVVRDAGHLPARKSPLGHGAAADDAARCGGGLTTIRSASTKAAPLVQRRLQYFNHEFWKLIDPRRTKSLRSQSRRTRLVCQRCDYVSRHRPVEVSALRGVCRLQLIRRVLALMKPSIDALKSL